jgi:hypothetical protein
VIALPLSVNLDNNRTAVDALPARMNEKVMQVPATPLTMELSDIVGSWDQIGKA